MGAIVRPTQVWLHAFQTDRTEQFAQQQRGLGGLLFEDISDARKPLLDPLHRRNLHHPVARVLKPVDLLLKNAYPLFGLLQGLLEYVAVPPFTDTIDKVPKLLLSAAQLLRLEPDGPRDSFVLLPDLLLHALDHVTQGLSMDNPLLYGADDDLLS